MWAQNNPFGSLWIFKTIMREKESSNYFPVFYSIFYYFTKTFALYNTHKSTFVRTLNNFQLTICSGSKLAIHICQMSPMSITVNLFNKFLHLFPRCFRKLQKTCIRLHFAFTYKVSIWDIFSSSSILSCSW